MSRLSRAPENAPRNPPTNAPKNVAENALEISSAVLSFTDGVRSSSSLATLVSSGPRTLDVDALAARALALPPTEPDETPYAGIRCAILEPAAVESPRKQRSTTPAAAARALRESMLAAVARALGSARRVAVMAGGGLDSAGLLALALEWARPRGAEVFAVALDFPSRCDDRPYLRALEEALRCEVIRVHPEEGARHLTAWMGGIDAAPFCWPSGPMEIEMMVRAREHGADCVLMGVGGDELFDGQPEALAALVRRGRPLTALRSARRLRGFARPRSRTFSWILRPLVARSIPTAVRLRLARRTRPWMPRWAGPKMVDYLQRLHAREIAGLERNLPRGISVDPLHLERHYTNVGWLRHQEEVAARIQRRDPFLDRALIETVRSIDPPLMLCGDIRRGLFREALRDVLPTPLLEREDKAYFEPAFLRMTAAAGGLESLRELASGRELADLELVHPRLFREAFAEFVAAPDEGWPWMTIWPALFVERFLRERGGTSSS